MNAMLLRGQRVIEYLTSLFPLLTRELTEQAARKRTFVLRAIYAVILYGCTFFTLWEEMSRWSNQSFAFMGRGKELFETLAQLQFYGIYLFLPAMTCGVLTSEKERDTLSLLMLSRLGGWSIILGKLFSRKTSCPHEPRSFNTRHAVLKKVPSVFRISSSFLQPR